MNTPLNQVSEHWIQKRNTAFENWHGVCINPVADRQQTSPLINISKAVTKNDWWTGMCFEFKCIFMHMIKETEQMVAIKVSGDSKHQ